MSITSETNEFLDKVKANFDIAPGEDGSEGWVINGEVLFFVPLGEESDKVFMLSTPMDESILHQDEAIRLTRAASLQRDRLLKYNMSIAINDSDQFEVLQQVIYPDTAEEACAAIANFLVVSKQLSDVIASINAEAEEDIQ